jgi:hypothetical protein
MKDMKMKFGFKSVVAGQKSATVNAEPRLIANSTTGKFSLTAPVTKLMGVAVGENIMFLNNIAEVEAAVANPSEDLNAWAADNGIDLTTIEGQNEAIKALTAWAIAKGVPMYDSKGNPVKARERYTKEDKQKYIDANADEILAANRAALIERNGGEDADDDTLKALISVDDIEAPEYHACTGSKTATTGAATGVGCQLNFTDTAIWNLMKKDIPADERTNVNRVFEVKLEEGFKTVVDNGTRDGIEVMAYPVEFLSDEEPMVRGKKEEGEEE